MSEVDPERTPNPAAVLESMSLLATLSTAVDVRESVIQRQAGHDPAAQEPSDWATARLRNSGSTLMDLLMQLMLSRVPLEQEGEAPLPRAVRHFDLLMKLRRAERLVQDMHQRLLSLYPDVSEALVEEARLVRDRLSLLSGADPTDTEIPALSDVLERATSFVVWVRHEV